MEHQRQRTKLTDIAYGLYLYFLDLSYRNTAKALQRFVHSRSHVSIWKWIKKYKPKKVLSSKRKKSNEFIIDETQIKVGSQYISGSGLQSIEPKHRQIILQIDLSIYLSSERTMLVAERFIIASLINKFGKCPV
ncbi:MAG: hypothetical protein WCF06_10125, partial [Nitrososphaeraceae archaeon]